MKKLLFSVFSALILFNQFSSKAIAAHGYITNIDQLSKQMDQLAAEGAAGFLIWQYSGNLSANEYFGNDKYSFFQDTENGQAVCELLSNKKSNFDFVGVNMWNVGASNYSESLVEKHFKWLKDNCGVTVVRTFAKEGGAAGMQKVLTAAKNAGIKVIIAIGDYSNGGGGIPAGADMAWYRSGYQDHKQFAEKIAASVSNHPALHTLELANEPHCGGEPPETLDYYTNNWGKDVASVLQGHGAYVGYGQMANPNGVCDSPSSGGFQTSNSIPQINITSAHFYNETEYQASLEALRISNQLGKPFYIGEANIVTNLSKSTNKSLSDYITYPLIANPDKYADEESGVVKYMKNLILEQGYEVHCAHPNLVITHEAIGNFQEYFEQTGRDMVTFDNRDSEKINMNQAKIPLYRGSEASEATLKTSSFEGFLGVINPNPSEEQKQNTAANSGVANNLLNRSQQCIIKLKNLETAKQVCESLEQPEACTFHEQIANSDYYLYSTPAQEALEPSLLTKIKSSGLDCQDLSLPWSQELGIEQEEFEKISQAISNTPLDLDKLYRYAFVILSPEHDLDDAQMKGSCGVKDPADRFWFLSFDPNHSSCHGEGHIYLPKHNPLFVAIKIPVTLTNEVKNYSYQDSGNITADILTTTEVQQQIDQKADEKRSKLFDASMAAKEIHDHGTEEEKLGLIINCSGMPRCEGAHGAGVDLLKALVHIVNGSHKVCSDFDQQVTQDPYAILNEQDNPNPIGALEQVEEIGTPAKYSAAAQRQFKLEYNEINFESAKSQSWDWMLKIKKGDNPNDPTVQEKVGIHIVAPLGADIEYLQSRFASFFTEDALAKTIADNTLPASENRTGIVAKYLPINFAELGFQSSATRNYSHPDCPCQRDELGYCKTDIYGNEIKTDCKQVKVKLDDHNVGLYLARGGRLAFMIREVIQSITSTTSKAYAYVASCKNLEDLFTGGCSGEVESREPTAGEIENKENYAPRESSNIDCPITTIGFTSELESAARNKKSEFLTEISTNWPNTFMNGHWYDYVVDASREIGLNPVLVLALGREETAWGAVGHPAVLGCLGTNNDGETIQQAINKISLLSKERRTIDHQLECIAKNFDRSISCEDFMCRYSGESMSAPCTFNNNPNFPINLPKYYNRFFE